MSDLRQAAQQAQQAQQALEALEEIIWSKDSFLQLDAITALRTALEQQAKPVAVYGYCPDCGAKGVTRERRPNGDDKCTNGHTYPSSTATPVQPLLMNHNGAVRKVHGYPPQRHWVGLTDEDVRQCSQDVVAGGQENSVDRFAYAIEDKLKEKNT